MPYPHGLLHQSPQEFCRGALIPQSMLSEPHRMNTLGSWTTDRRNGAGRPHWPGRRVRMVGAPLSFLLIRVELDTVHCPKSGHVRIGVCLASCFRNKPDSKPREELTRSLTNYIE
jgi:hypothetical protein